MYGNKIYEDLTPLYKRSGLVWIGIQIAFAALAFFYWKIQILDHARFWTQAEANRTRDIAVPAPRGILKDRTGRILLADNRSAFRASIIRENTRDLEKSIREIGVLLALDPAVIRERIDKYRTLPSFQSIVIKDDLTLAEVAMIEARRVEHPELIIEMEPKRSYPFGPFAAHVLGYMQELSPEELRSVFKGRRPGDMVGKTGIEATYENDLVGREGQTIDIVDSLGRKKDEILHVEPVASAGLSLSLDYDLQAKAQELLQGREGAIVALSPRTGEVLAMASFPTYDPNSFINRFTPQEWEGLANNPEHPLLNRAIQGLYSPGSTFKIIMSAAGLGSGSITEQTQFVCGGEIEIYGNPFSCMGVHGALALSDAIRYSCNIYFYNLGRRLGIETIADYAQRMGLGRKTGIDIPGEKEGLVPTPEWKKRVRKAPWFPGETISVAIGQGPILVTPLQMATIAAVVANRGRTIRPHVALTLGEEPAAAVRGLEPAVFETIVEGMWRSVNAGGSGRAALVEGFDVCGKTGSTQTISTERAEKISAQAKEKKTHAWFVGFAPRRNPEIVVAVLVEYSGLGGAAAAPAAREIFDLYRTKHARPYPASGN